MIDLGRTPEMWPAIVPANKFHEGSGADGKHYWLTPPDLYAALDAEFRFDFDPCPYPLPDGFDGLTCEWGRSNYVNPPFGSIIHEGKVKGPTAWVRKAITEHRKGKTVVFVYPIDKWVLMLLEAVGAHVRNLGDVRWCSTEDGQPGPGTGRQHRLFHLGRRMTKLVGLIRFGLIVAALTGGSLALYPTARSGTPVAQATAKASAGHGYVSDVGLRGQMPPTGPPVQTRLPGVPPSSPIASSPATAAATAKPSDRASLRGSPRKTPAPLLRPVAAGIHTPTLRGTATYYGTGGPGMYAAMGGYRDGTRVVVSVTGFHDGRTWTVTLNVVTQCGACRWRAGAVLIDLSIPAWNVLGWPLSRGVIPVTVTILEGEYPA